MYLESKTIFKNKSDALFIFQVISSGIQRVVILSWVKVENIFKGHTVCI